MVARAGVPRGRERRQHAGWPGDAAQPVDRRAAPPRGARPRSSSAPGRGRRRRAGRDDPDPRPRSGVTAVGDPVDAAGGAGHVHVRGAAHPLGLPRRADRPRPGDGRPRDPRAGRVRPRAGPRAATRARSSASTSGRRRAPRGTRRRSARARGWRSPASSSPTATRTSAAIRPRTARTCGVSATGGRDADGRAQVTVTITNAGPLAADLPDVTDLAVRSDVRRLQDGRPAGLVAVVLRRLRLWLAIAPGETRTLTLTGDAPGATTAFVHVSVRRAGPQRRRQLRARSASRAAGAARVRRRAGEVPDARGRASPCWSAPCRPGRARVTVAFKVRGQTVKLGKVVKLKPCAARAW